MENHDFEFPHPAIRAVIELEQLMLSPAVRADYRQMHELLADDFRGISRAGKVVSKSSWLKGLGGFASSWGPTGVALGVHGKMLNDDVVLLTYFTAGSAGRVCRSSVWRRSSASWKITFHQATPAPVHDADSAGEVAAIPQLNHSGRGGAGQVGQG